MRSLLPLEPRGLQQGVVDDLRRTSIVFAVAAVDTYMHRQVVERASDRPPASRRSGWWPSSQRTTPCAHALHLVSARSRGQIRTTIEPRDPAADPDRACLQG